MANQPFAKSLADLLRAQSNDPQALILRMLDIGLAMAGLIIAAPLLILIAALIRLDSRGPVIFRDERVGKDFKRFSMFKFRTMLECSTKIRQSVCPRHDPRVTPFGRFLRKSKLNELPQLFNVLLGDMSFVGPRPEAPDLAEMYPEEAKIIFRVKPGLVGPAVVSVLRENISGRDEEELYPPGVDPKQYYIEHILPIKLKIELYHLSRQTIVSYFGVILSAVKETVTGVLSGRPADGDKRAMYLFIADVVFCQVAFAAAYQLFIWSPLTHPSVGGFLSGILLVTAVRPLINASLGLYNLVLELVTSRDIFRVIRASALGSLVLVFIGWLVGTRSYPLEVAALDCLLLGTMLASVRLLILWRYRMRDGIERSDSPTRVFIFGAQRQGLRALCSLAGSKNSPFRAVGFIDDAEERYGKKIRGVKVLGNRHHIQALSTLYDVKDLIIAPQDGQPPIAEIVTLCSRAKVRTRVFEKTEQDGRSNGTSFPLRPALISDMLPAVTCSLDEAELRSLVTKRTVLMLGSGAELGEALCRKILACGGRKLVIVDRYESRVCRMLADFRCDLPECDIVPEVLDSPDTDGLERIFSRHSPQIVIHAGMRKYVSLSKPNEDEVALSNYFLTFNLARAAQRHGCEYFLVISSIKAASRNSFVSESLRVAEFSLNMFFRNTTTRLILTRVGNIMENQGGVVSRLTDQLLERRSVRLPAESARIYILSKEAAARSILQALVIGTRISPGGFLRTAEPGTCLKLTEVVARIADLFGLTIGSDIILKFGEIPEGMIDDEPSFSMASGVQDPACFERLPVSDLDFLTFEDMISGGASRLTPQDWRKRTDEIVRLYGPLLDSYKQEARLH